MVWSSFFACSSSRRSEAISPTIIYSEPAIVKYCPTAISFSSNKTSLTRLPITQTLRVSATSFGLINRPSVTLIAEILTKSGPSPRTVKPPVFPLREISPEGTHIRGAMFLTASGKAARIASISFKVKSGSRPALNPL